MFHPIRPRGVFVPVLARAIEGALAYDAKQFRMIS